MKKYIIVLGVLSIVGCFGEDKTTISQEKMVDVLTDLTVASSARSVANKRDSVQYYVTYKSILEKHGTDSLEFAKAQKFYQNYPDVYAVIYDSVTNRIQKELEAVRATPEEKEDKQEVTPVSRLRDISIGRKELKKLNE